MRKLVVILFLLGNIYNTFSQSDEGTYVKKVLDNTEVDLLFSYYEQDGTHAAVTGGEGTEKLTDIAPTIVVSVPLGDDNVLVMDAGISAYTSASSSNINPFDGKNPANPWVESSGASRSDVLSYVHPTFSHSSKDRNNIVSANISFSNEFDYNSIGFGGGYTRLMNEKNTELGISAQVYLDRYNPQYPIELRDGFAAANANNIIGTGNYASSFSNFKQLRRNSYSASLNFSQIITKRFQASFSIDFVFQEGLLSTPHQRVYFADKNDFFIDDFQLADDVERLPFYRYKLPIGTRISYALSDVFTIRGYYRYYWDDWGITSSTASIQLPIKLSDQFTVYPMYRYYVQTASKYFYQKEEALSTYKYYTSDYDLSRFDANQFGIGLSYKDIFTKAKIWKLGLKSVDLRYNNYQRNINFKATIVSLGFQFILE